jgi:uncharacterized membrane protein
MNVYLLLVFVHVAAAMALLSGSVIGSPAVRAAVRRAVTTQEMRAYLGIGRPLSMLEPVSALVVLASGVYLTSVAHFWTLGWVQVATVFWFVNAVVAAAVIKPALGRLVAETAAATDGPVSRPLDVLRWSRRWSVGGDLLLANDATMLFLMTMKPGLFASLLAVAMANLAIGSIRLAAGRQPQPQPATVLLTAEPGGLARAAGREVGDIAAEEPVS